MPHVIKPLWGKYRLAHNQKLERVSFNDFRLERLSIKMNIIASYRRIIIIEFRHHRPRRGGGFEHGPVPVKKE